MRFLKSKTISKKYDAMYIEDSFIILFQLIIFV